MRAGSTSAPQRVEPTPGRRRPAIFTGDRLAVPVSEQRGTSLPKCPPPALARATEGGQAAAPPPTRPAPNGRVTARTDSVHPTLTRRWSSRAAATSRARSFSSASASSSCPSCLPTDPSSAASVTPAPSFLGWPYLGACAFAFGRRLPLAQQGHLPADTDRQAQPARARSHRVPARRRRW